MEIIGTPLGVRKGAWTEDEDRLLRRYVEKYGEGKWHQTPLRAGLNRCRKSCRMRWLNYLKPTINRGNFGGDEVDMMVRLHKLLGNRWSLIAGRLPGRTANDVKNYWNTHLRMKLILSEESEKEAKQPEVIEAKIIRPQPRKLSKILPLSMGTERAVKTNINGTMEASFTKPVVSPTISALGKIDGTFWWDNMELDNTRITWSSTGGALPEDEKVFSQRLHATSVDTSAQEWWDNIELVDTGIKWSSITDLPEDEKVISPGLHATSVDTSVQEWWDNMKLDHTGITWSSIADLPKDEKVISPGLHATNDTFVQESLQSDLNGYFTNCVDLWGLLAD